MQDKEIEVLFNRIKSHIENWKDQCMYDIPFDYIGLKDILLRDRDSKVGWFSDGGKGNYKQKL